ncbi:SH3 domain-containing protein [Acetobacter indonesiensis]|uniref:SH3 domain-containing protein n=1 Tax=Acetobacter indonesiensis TaxID=104101 RepID=UPI0020A39ABC|nr:SH3 domain-containing protein [Acetobacter indonesiensis]MCP1231115.1 SH3 domain-containing protein [Acetobacter indonesiensis]
MMFRLPSTFRFQLLSCVAGCVFALSGAMAADKKSDAHKHHAHAGAATHDAAAKKKAATKKAAKDSASQKEASGKHAHHDAKTHDAKGKAHHAAATHGAAHHIDKHKAATATAGAAAGAAAATGAATAAPTDAAAAPAATPPEPPKGTVTGLPLPRYASLRADEVNMRAGPGRRFPILWVYHRRGMPMRIEREFDVWRLVEDPTGQKGWVQQATISGGRDFLIPGEPPGDETPIPEKTDKNGVKIPPSGHMDTRVLGTVATAADAKNVAGAVPLYASASTDAAVVAILKPGTVGSVKECAAGSDWCKVSVKQYNGWISRRAIWGVDAEEAISPS